jgi:hypothetical protein
MATIPRQEFKTGADCTGVSGDPDRTFALSYSGLITDTLVINKSGSALYKNVDYTLSGSTVTFLGEIYDDEQIAYFYFTLHGATPTDISQPRYASVVQFIDALGIRREVPEWAAGSSPAKELVATGDSSTGVFYLDYKNVVYGTVLLYTGGATEALCTTTLTETTHYVVELKTGKITLTAAGVTLVGTFKLYAAYSYVDTQYNLSSEYLADVLVRCEEEIDGETNTTFNNAAATNPSLPYVLQEERASKGWFDRTYFTRHRPIIDCVSNLNGNIAAGDVTLVLDDASLFPSQGYIIIDAEVIRYTGISTNTLTGLVRGSFDTAAAIHLDNAEVHTTIAEVSATPQGQAPNWTVLSWNDEMFAREVTGAVQIYENSMIAPDYISSHIHRDQNVASRFRITYYYGYGTIPRDIERLAILFAKKSMMTDTVGRSIIAGRNEFNPGMFDYGKSEVDRILARYRQLPMGNT